MPFKYLIPQASIWAIKGIVTILMEHKLRCTFENRSKKPLTAYFGGITPFLN